ncbi:hypothetical protein [Neotabrizicola shimadae]|uniref:Uncharacterized protein n=1 Tax=Neotabrizicola shimadae TaxID=2807096 RepID=A0A8G0ZV60_9RHOB|nr:hypothetical protein [Neotabrizicola shimadae]QYZ70010.1 hypothetical protein JO391_00235 [Neotabrizicola shimadae]
MGKKSEGKGKGKGSQLVIRIDKAEREAFVTLCDALDTTAAREIRRFMRGFVAAHATGEGKSEDAAEQPAQAKEPPATDTAAPPVEG